jgi:hypothetical protein
MRQKDAQANHPYQLSGRLLPINQTKTTDFDK